MLYTQHRREMQELLRAQFSEGIRTACDAVFVENGVLHGHEHVICKVLAEGQDPRPRSTEFLQTRRLVIATAVPSIHTFRERVDTVSDVRVSLECSLRAALTDMTRALDCKCSKDGLGTVASIRTYGHVRVHSDLRGIDHQVECSVLVVINHAACIEGRAGTGMPAETDAPTVDVPIETVATTVATEPRVGLSRARTALEASRDDLLEARRMCAATEVHVAFSEKACCVAKLKLAVAVAKRNLIEYNHAQLEAGGGDRECSEIRAAHTHGNACHDSKTGVFRCNPGCVTNPDYRPSTAVHTLSRDLWLRK